MPRQTEPNANNALGILLQGMMHGCSIRSENTQAIVGQAGLQPDIVITESGRAPIIIEAEFEPARDVEDEAEARLGLEVVDGRRTVEAVIALKYPASVADADDLNAALSDARLSYCVLYAEESETRFPETGWLTGSIGSLADMIRLVSVPQKAINDAADALERGIGRVAAILDELDKGQPTVTMEIANLLGMVNVPQTRRMACAIIANALVFHERIVGRHQGVNVKPLRLVCGPDVANPQAETLAAWNEILKVNYWPIFAVGRDILNQIPSNSAARILRTLELTVGEVNATGIDNSHDLTGRVFQRLIADRKYLATFYTLSASAALLARLAVDKMQDVDWSDRDAIGKLRIGDFACGTGALLSAVYEQLAARHERAGGDPEALHTNMMEEVLYGCDVMPSAIHITGSALSGARPNVGFDNSRLYTLPYGKQGDGSVAIGSLELLQSSSVMTLFNTSDPALRTGSAGEETAANVIVDIHDEGFDVVIMNPPFTRATNHEGAHADITNPAFAAFGATKADQTAMGNRMNQFGRGTCYHGNAGIASAFAALAHRKLKPGGVLALVLPLSAASGLSWQGFRRMIAQGYTDLTVLSIAANGKDMSFSSDTGMAECLVITRKLMKDDPPTLAGKRIGLTSLGRRPRGLAPAAAAAEGIINSDSVRRIEDGPYGGTRLEIGGELIGEMLSTPDNTNGETWGAVRSSDFSVAQVGYALSHSKLWLPNQSTPPKVGVAPLNVVGRMGLVDRDITGPMPRGPFDKVEPSPTAAYPALWNHDAKRETRMVCEPDSQLIVRIGMEAKSHEVWATASRAHLNRDFTFGSQALAVAFTEWESIGGRVWPNVTFDDTGLDYAFAVWGNSTLGLLLYWWHSSRQQSSKAGITIRSAESLPVLDFRALTDEQLATAEAIFDEFRDKELKPAYLADADPNRALLDKRVVCDLLGFDEEVYEGVRRLSQKWCAEPSVHGGKKRPRDAQFVM
ncbi:MAG: hypothetical protein F4X72_05425 [Dehalococcoidia bacterium]|nr:hypothetical protein [Dehalococcoidia bacterium]